MYAAFVRSRTTNCRIPFVLVWDPGDPKPKVSQLIWSRRPQACKIEMGIPRGMPIGTSMGMPIGMLIGTSMGSPIGIPMGIHPD